MKITDNFNNLVEAILESTELDLNIGTPSEASPDIDYSLSLPYNTKLQLYNSFRNHILFILFVGLFHGLLLGLFLTIFLLELI